MTWILVPSARNVSLPADPWINLDGRLGAPQGTAAFPTQFAGDATRPAWKVPNIDYPVGIDRAIYPTDSNLKDPLASGGTVIAPALVTLGAIFDGGGAITYVKLRATSDVVIDGYDFSLHGGLTLFLQTNGFAVTLQNCKFVVGTNARECIDGDDTGSNTYVQTNITIQNCYVDGNGLQNSAVAGGLIQRINCSGTFLIQYNRIRRAWFQLLQVGPTGGTSGAGQGIFHARYNSNEDAGVGRTVDVTVHGDYYQFYGGSAFFYQEVILEFNLNLQNFAGADTQGHSLFFSGGSLAGSQKITTNANVSIMLTNENFPYTFDPSFTSNLICTNEYFDMTGTTQTASPKQWIQVSNTGTGPYASPTQTFSNQINLKTGDVSNTANLGGT